MELYSASSHPFLRQLMVTTHRLPIAFLSTTVLLRTVHKVSSAFLRIHSSRCKWPIGASQKTRGSSWVRTGCGGIECSLSEGTSQTKCSCRHHGGFERVVGGAGRDLDVVEESGGHRRVSYSKSNSAGTPGPVRASLFT